MTDRLEQMFHQARDKAEAEVRQNAKDWSDKIEPEMADVFRALDKLGAPEKACEIAEAAYEAFDLWSPDAGEVDENWLSEDAKTVFSLNHKFNLAYKAQSKTRRQHRVNRLNAEAGQIVEDA